MRSKPLARRSGRRWLETRFSFDTEPPYYVIAWHILFLTAIPEIRIGFITALHRFGGDNQTIKKVVGDPTAMQHIQSQVRQSSLQITNSPM